MVNRQHAALLPGVLCTNCTMRHHRLTGRHCPAQPSPGPVIKAAQSRAHLILIEEGVKPQKPPVQAGVLRGRTVEGMETAPRENRQACMQAGRQAVREGRTQRMLACACCGMQAPG